MFKCHICAELTVFFFSIALPVSASLSAVLFHSVSTRACIDTFSAKHHHLVFIVAVAKDYVLDRTRTVDTESSRFDASQEGYHSNSRIV